MAPWVIGKTAPGVHLANFADGTVGNPFADKTESLTTVALNSHLCGDFGFPCGFGELAGLVNIVAQRLLAIDVFAGLNSRHGDDSVGVVRSGDEHGINVLLLFQQLAVISVQRRTGVSLDDGRSV